MFIVLNHRSKKILGEKWPQTRFFFSITSIVSTSRRFREPSGRQTLFLRGCLEIDFPPPSIVCARPLQSTLSTLLRLFSGVQRRHLASKLSSSSAAPRSSFCWPDFYKLMECVCAQDFVVFAALAPSDIYIYSGLGVFSKLFAPKSDVPR